MTMLLPEAEHIDVSQVLEHYRAHGYARLGRVLSDEGLALLRARTDALMLGEVTHPGLFFQMDSTTGRSEDAPLGLGWQGPSLLYRKLEKLEADPLFLQWLSNPLFERVARGVIDGPIVLYRTILFNKGLSGGSEIPWHQDGGKLWGLSEDPPLQIWTALDDAPADGGCLEVVPDSHHTGLASPLGGVVPAEKAVAAEGKGVSLPVSAGESIVLHNMVWHRSNRGRPGSRRRAMSVCFMSAATRCLRKKKTPRVFFPVFGHSRT